MLIILGTGGVVCWIILYLDLFQSGSSPLAAFYEDIGASKSSRTYVLGYSLRNLTLEQRILMNPRMPGLPDSLEFLSSS